MIIFKRLEWSNFFSYGEGNVIDFMEARLTQLVGKNGTGKSSIPLILEEILYGKNSKGIKKQDILNRYVKDKELRAKLHFSVSNEDYVLTYSRKSTLKVELWKGTENISAHTSTDTMKMVEELIDLPYKTFTQLVYQSSTASLEFLTATDTTRKKFLTSLFGLEEYTDIFNAIKSDVVNVANEIKVCNNSAVFYSNAYEEELRKGSTPKVLPLDEPEPIDNSAKIIELSVKQNSIEQENTAIKANNAALTKRFEILEKLEKTDSSAVDHTTKITTLNTDKAVLEAAKKRSAEIYKKVSTLHSKCPTCYQPIDYTVKEAMLETIKTEGLELNGKIKEITDEIERMSTETERAKARLKLLSNLRAYTVNTNLPTTLYDSSTLSSEIATLKQQAKDRADEIARIRKYNSSIKNTEVSAELLTKYSEKLEEVKKQAATLSAKLAKLEILKKAFSTSGLISYKLEFLVKDLESLINKYMGELSDGRFIMNFVLAGDKLDIAINDNGNTIGIDCLSAGELSRVNVATLLAIRQLMNSLSKNRMNLLFLDEILGVIDSDGKDKITEILMEEELNTYLVAHDYAYPLLHKVTVEKQGNISRIIHDR